jgi:hypothetical protein
MKRLGALPEDDSIETRKLFAKPQAIANMLKREILGVPPRVIPAGIFPSSPPPPARLTPVSKPVEAPRRPPVATGEVPSGVTVIRNLVLNDDKT